MNRPVRHYSALVLGWLLAMSLMLLGQNPKTANGFALFLIPLVLLGGVLEFSIGIVVTSVLAVASLVAGFWLHWLPQPAAVTALVAVGIASGLAALLSQDRDARLKAEAKERQPLEHELLRVERKGYQISRQIEGYKEKLDNLITLYQVAKKLSGTIKLESMLDEARVEVAQLFPQHFSDQSEEDARLAFYVPDDDSEDFLRVGLRGHEVSDEGFPDRLPAAEILAWLGDSYSAIRIKDMCADPRFRYLTQQSQLRSLVGIPLIMHDIVIGLMLLATAQPGSFTPTDFSQAETLGKQIVFALRKSLLYRKVQTLSFTDSQTGLYVHRYFQERLREELHRAERYRQHLSLIMLDLDHFKRVNDQHGHQAGDAVLVEAASRIQEMAGPTALAARYGGEEFAVLLPNTPLARAVVVAQGINSYLKATPIEAGGLKLTLTISAGVSVYPDHALSREVLITTADTALYQAKRDGRDLVKPYDESMGKRGA
ncbi:MAG: diguanylate cyclase [candidate division FCPU426 bacterium]